MYADVTDTIAVVNGVDGRNRVGEDCDFIENIDDRVVGGTRRRGCQGMCHVVVVITYPETVRPKKCLVGADRLVVSHFILVILV